MNNSLKLFLFFTFILINLTPHQIFATVTTIPVSGFHELESHIDAYKQAHPSTLVLAMVDCDRVLTGEYDMDGIHRHATTSSTLASLASKGTPTLIATARFLTHFDSLRHSESWDRHKEYSVQMLENLGLTFSDHEGQLHDLDLRDESYHRGIFVNRVLYTGNSKKGETIARFVDNHPFFQQHKASRPDEGIHLFIIDDDAKYVTQIQEAFQDRPENVTILHYIYEPNFQETPFSTLFGRDPIPTDLSDLWYFIRHNHHTIVQETLIRYQEPLQTLPSQALASLVIDAIFSDNPENFTLLCAHTPLARSKFPFSTLLNFMYYADSKDKVHLINPLLQTFFKDPEMKMALRDELKDIKEPDALNAPVVKELLSLLRDQS